jgi:lipoate-protein ligase B
VKVEYEHESDMRKNVENFVGLSILDRGLMDYSAALELQLELVEKRISDEIGNVVLLVEHPPVITLGARGDENILLVGEEQLKADGFEVAHVRRGGGVTAHNPGQIVMYPIVNLSSVNMDIGEYIGALESLGIELLEGMSVTATRKKGAPGLWIGEKKIASIGVKVKRRVTYHGMAINICNDLSIFDKIVPCGLQGVEMTSALREVGGDVSIEDVKVKLDEIIRRRFSGDKD